MAKIKHTKTELKAQSDALKRFDRFLPMLQLKKQQLQMEIAGITTRIEALERDTDSIQTGLDCWVALFSDPVDLDGLVVLERVITEEGNIAGVRIPIFTQAVTSQAELDLFESPSWLDDAQEVCARLLALQAETAILATQRDLITEELRVTSQRVNLFEKVKIPECRENIRVIKIFLGDEQTSAVARGKIAKRRGTDSEPSAEELAA